MTKRNEQKMKEEQPDKGDKISVLSGFATLVFVSVLMAIGLCLFFYTVVCVIHFANPALYAATQLMKLTQNATSLMLYFDVSTLFRTHN